MADEEAKAILDQGLLELNIRARMLAEIVNNLKKKETLDVPTQIALAESIWDQAQKDNGKFQKMNMPDHKYFKLEYFDQIKELYDEAMGLLREQITKEAGPTTPVEPNVSALEGVLKRDDGSALDVQGHETKEQNLRLKKQHFRISNLHNFLRTIRRKMEEDISGKRCKTLLEQLQKQWEEIRILDEEIMVREAEFTDTYFINNPFDDVKIMVEETMDKLEEKLEEAERPREEKKLNIQLPKIRIPVFSGGYDEWVGFQDLFTKIVHENPSITDCEKMQYLKTYVKGEAAKSIQHLHVTDNNYHTAWNILKHRYQNRRLITSKLIDKLLDFPEIQTESPQNLKNLYDTTVEVVEGLYNLGVDTDTWDAIIGRIMARKWDDETNRLYEQQLEKPMEIQALDVILQFLQRRFQSLEQRVQTRKTPTGSNNNNKAKAANTATNHTCWHCHGQHLLVACFKFKSLSVQERNNLVEEKGLCKICLRHPAKDRCGHQFKCGVCNKAHNTLLHWEMKQTTKPSSVPKATTSSGNQQQQQGSRPPKGPQKTTNHVASVEEESQKAEVIVTAHLGRQQDSVLLPTALVEAKATDGSTTMLRVLIDQGSQSSFITEEAAQLLALPRQKIKVEVSGLGEGEAKLSKSKINAVLTPRFRSLFALPVELLVLPKLTKPMPQHSFENNIEAWNNKILADPTFARIGPIDILLGAREYSKIILNGLEKKEDGLVGQDTELGWIVSGPVPEAIKTKIVTSLVACMEDCQLTKFWETEEVCTPQQQLKEEDRLCEDMYKETTRRNEDGTYTVRIPFKQPVEELGNSRTRAVARFLQLEGKFGRDPNLKQQYGDFMKEYRAMGHMEKVRPDEIGRGKYYIPHQAVIREESSTTKLRVVFDASSRTSNGRSLNNIMYVGPKLLPNLAEILLRWRKYPVVFKADVEKMFRQIKIHPEDYNYQRIIWRDNPSEPLEEMVLKTVTYGTASAPYLANRTLKQLAEDEGRTYPRASAIVKEDTYVDDILSGANSEEEALQLYQELQEMFISGGFNLRKWSSNSNHFIETLPPEQREQVTIVLQPDESQKALGVVWSPVDDTFRFRIKLTETKKVTKRHILSEIARLFDPLGWLAPVIVKAKMIIQVLWLNKLDWDQSLDKDTEELWMSFRNQLKTLEDIKIPRWCNYRGEEMEIHGFSDASEKAYGAVVYSRIKTNGKYVVTLLQAKSKVAPTKGKVTLPRLELCGAVLLAKLVKQTIEALRMKNQVKVYAWTDSMITLGWIKGDPLRWKTYVANRVSEITDLIPSEKWNHVKSGENPADMVSRGMDPEKLKTSFWWNGPSWLQNGSLPDETTVPEVAIEKRVCLQTQVVNKESRQELFLKFSSWTTMIRVISYCKRVTKQQKEITLSSLELEDATKIIIRIIQEENFSEDYKLLKKNLQVKKNSSLKSLDPFLDENGVLRVGGRLQNSALPKNQMHPIILPGKHHVTDLIIKEAHLKVLHGGIQATMAYLRRKFWIINAKKNVKSIINKCTKCIRYKGEAAQQQMGQLPAARVTPSHPFTHTGLDYAGPIQVRATKGRGHSSYKGYIAIFVCLSTKAIHLEVVSDLSTDAFLAAYRRFTARRGSCKHMYSDNATNFVGAKALLKKEVTKAIRSSDVQDKLTTSGTQWHFIPPSAPHFGGLWEAGVKSMKHHLHRVIGDSKLTFEELSTLMCQIEACLNSRPLCGVGGEVAEEIILTPGHFLIGQELVTPPDPIETNINSNLSQRWRLIQKIKKDFWAAWSTEYLSRLQQRYKWTKSQDNLKTGQIVLIKEDSINPSRWPMAKITDVYSAKDAKIRVVTVKKAGGSELKRPIHKLIPLPVCEDKEEQLTRVQSNFTCTNKESAKRGIGCKSLYFLFLLLCTLCTMGEAGYKIKQPEPGLYIEHLGHARIDRGIFRIKVNYEKSKLQEDITAGSKIVHEYEELCLQSEKIVKDVRCKSLKHHLEEQEEAIKWIEKSLSQFSNKKRKRGILGQILTSVFGVNDEVYQDIDKLDANQKELIKASTHQTKVMVATLASINETETRMANQIERFRIKLNQGLELLNQMQGLFTTVDFNRLDIHLLSTYQVANNFLNEVYNRYSKLVDVYFNRGTIYDVISPHYVNNTIARANEKLPSNLKILQTPLYKISAEQNKTDISIYGHFLIVDVAEYMLLLVTPTPIKIENGSYWELEISKKIIAVEYNLQLYFELTANDLRDSFVMSVNLTS